VYGERKNKNNRRKKQALRGKRKISRAREGMEVENDETGTYQKKKANRPL